MSEKLHYMMSKSFYSNTNHLHYSTLLLYYSTTLLLQYIHEWLPNARGALLFRQQLIPSGPLNGVVGICHGFMDHTNSFHTELAIKFCEKGYAVVMMDAEGHGLSGMYMHIRMSNEVVFGKGIGVSE
jgi:hypothetical protein